MPYPSRITESFSSSQPCNQKRILREFHITRIIRHIFNAEVVLDLSMTVVYSVKAVKRPDGINHKQHKVFEDK